MPQLLPCPFCGGRAFFVAYTEPSDARILCRSVHCTAEMSLNSGMDSVQALADQWNRRANKVPVTDDLIRLDAVDDDSDTLVKIHARLLTALGTLAETREIIVTMMDSIWRLKQRMDA